MIVCGATKQCYKPRRKHHSTFGAYRVRSDQYSFNSNTLLSLNTEKHAEAVKLIVKVFELVIHLHKEMVTTLPIYICCERGPRTKLGLGEKYVQISGLQYEKVSLNSGDSAYF